MPLSYKLHEELAKEHGGEKRWGYRTVYCGSLGAKGKVHDGTKGEGAVKKGEEWNPLPKTAKKSKRVTEGIPKDLDWFDDEAVREYAEMGTPSTTAQVHPFQFTTSIADLAVEAGAKVILGSVTAIDYKGPEGVKGITYEDKETKATHTIPATDVILAAGPWTSHVFPEAPIEATRAHSVVIKADVSPYAVFSEIELPKDFGRREEGVKRRRHGASVSPEMYARPDGTVYACGEGDTDVPLPQASSVVVCDENRCQDILDYCGSISSTLRKGEVLEQQACYLPSVAGGGGPLIGQTGIRGLLMATGHTCWGIQNSCATGKLMSEFVFDGKAKSANVDSLDPRRVL